jgi:hypothetical protein
MSVPLSQSIVRVTELEELVSMLEIIPVAAVAVPVSAVTVPRVVAAVVYFGFKLLGLEKLDAKKE